jgi:hypothetical protein
MNKTVLLIEGGCYTLISAATPWLETIGGDRPITGRIIVAGAIASLIAGCTAMKAFLSTSFSRATGDAILVQESKPKTTTN